MAYDQTLGGKVYYKSDGTSKIVVATDDEGHTKSDLYVDNNGVWVVQNQSLTQGSKVEFENFTDLLFAVNYSEATRSFNGTSWSTSTNVTNAPKARYIKAYGFRLYLACVNIGGTSYPYRICFSSYPSSALAITWDTTNDYIDTPSQRAITALYVHNDRLLIFTEEELYRYDGNSLYLVPGAPGTKSQRSITVNGGYLYYYDGFGRGAWRYDGVSSEFIGRGIQPFADGVDAATLDEIASFADGDKVRFYVGTVTNSDEDISLSNAYFEYNTAAKCWFVGTQSQNSTVYFDYNAIVAQYTYDSTELTYDNDTSNYDGFLPQGRRILMGSNNSKIYQLESGFTDDSTNIPFVVETAPLFQGDPDIIKSYMRVTVRTKYGSSLMVQFKVDSNDWVTLGECQEESTSFEIMEQGKSITLRFFDGGSGFPVRLEGYSIFYIPTTYV